jgi:hypothetical protein
MKSDRIKWMITLTGDNTAGNCKINFKKTLKYLKEYLFK